MQGRPCYRVGDEGHRHDAIILGMEVWQEDRRVFLRQGKYAHDILYKFQMLNCRLMATPMTTNFWKLIASESKLVDATLYCQLIGSLMYLVNTRPDLSFAVNTLSQFIVEPRRVHWIAAKHVLRYIAGTVDYGMHMSGVMESDWWGIQTQIGQVVLATGRALVGVVSDWDRRLFPGSA